MASSEHPEPLRIGVLGASRIAPKSLIAPARELGHRLVVVASRDPERTRTYAAEHRFERVADSYADIVKDAEVDVVYNPLPNGLHAPWNIAALEAGKHVLSEKPSAANAQEAADVEAAVARSGRAFLEGFHYAFHPLFRRILAIVASGEIGELREVAATMRTPAPLEDDPRWDLSLAGGASMDLGCYTLHAARLLGAHAGGEPTVAEARAVERAGHPGVDERLTATLVYPSGASAIAACDMAAETHDYSLTVTGTRGWIHAPNFVLPQEDPRLVVRLGSASRVEEPSARPSFSFQLEAFADHVRTGTPLLLDPTDARIQLELTDAAYRAAGLPPRPHRPYSVAE